jgi:thioredoxin-related protein
VFGLLLLGSAGLLAQGVTWLKWDEALLATRSTGKIIMIDAVRDGCHFCVDMDNEVFEDAQMAAYIERCFIPVKVNLSHNAMPLDLTVPMTPSFYFIEGGTKLVKMIPGSWNKEDFRSFLEEMDTCPSVTKE